MIETTSSRLIWAARFLLASMLGTLLLSKKVWLTERNFPLVPIFDFFPTLPPPIDFLVYSVVLVLSMYQLVNLSSRKTLYALFGLFIFLLLGDQMRWQPYNIQYLLMLVGLIYIPTRSEDVIKVFRLILVTYFIWSGIQEFSVSFVDFYFPWLVGPFSKIFPAGMEPYVRAGGYLFPIINILTGIGLLFQKTRNYSVILGITIEVFLFYSLSPIANAWNYAILPFNLAMAGLLFVLFYNTEFPLKSVFWSRSFYLHPFTLVFFSLLPILSFFGLYDRMQSFNVYSGKSFYAKIYVTEELVNKLPDGIKRYVYRPAMDEPYIETTYWISDAVSVDPYSEKRVFEYLKDYVCSFAEGECQARLVIYTYANSRGS
jgi:hypothetical protein